MMLSVVDMGLATAFGPTLTAFHAPDAASAYFRNAQFINAAFQPQVCAFRHRQGVARFEDRVTTLLAEALSDLMSRRTAVLQVDVVLHLAEPCEGLPMARLQGMADLLMPQITAMLQAQGTLVPTGIRTVFGAQAGPTATLDLVKGPTLLLMADSYNDRARLQAMADADLLFSQQMPYGLVPGEAAGAMLVLPEVQPGLAVITGVSVTNEPTGERDGRDSVFTGLSDAAFDALDGTTARVARVVTDWNNSRYRASELAYCLQRLTRPHLVDGLEPDHASPAVGDVGAAYLAVAMAMALQGEGPALVLAGATHSRDRGAVGVDQSFGTSNKILSSK
jgi:hypothetical protein